MPLDQVFAIGGWSAPGVRSVGHDTYRPELQPDALQAVINRVSYPGLRLDPVFTVPAWTPESTAATPRPARTPRARKTAAKS